MKLAIMQPYLFPYIGYYQLIHAVDLFVVYDDVQYMKGGWINRNRILVNGQPKYLTLAVQRDHVTLPINKRNFVEDFGAAKQDLLRKMDNAYRRAPYFSETMNVIERCFECTDTNVSNFLGNTLKVVCEYLGLSENLIMSSSLSVVTGSSAEERVILINKTLKATTYINPVGGMDLYSRDVFQRHGLELYFLKSRELSYPQNDHSFVPNLSIVDVLMFNPLNAVQDLLKQYDLV